MIERDEQLTSWLPELHQSPWIAMDTEADSLHAYPEKLCLIQFSIQTGDFLIDPLSGMNLPLLWKSLSKRDLILHGADYDLRLLKRQHDFVPKHIFDTMIAARLMGCREFGLASLVAKFLNVTLEKGPQTADWAKRPLSSRMETYARNDTKYLKPLSDILRAHLQELGRLPWLEESCQALIQQCSTVSGPDPNTVWRVKGSFAMTPRALAILRELWHWRDAAATASNRPPYFILSHEMLVDLAWAVETGKPTDPLLPKKLSAPRREQINEVIQRALKIPQSQWPQLPRTESRRLTTQEKNRFEQLQTHRNKKAHELSIDPTLIASKATLITLAQDWEESRKLMQWQRKLLLD